MTHARIQEFSSVGGGGPGQYDKKAQTTVFLVLSLFYRSQMVNFKGRGGPTFSRGGGPTFSRGVPIACSL